MRAQTDHAPTKILVSSYPIEVDGKCSGRSKVMYTLGANPK